MHTFKHSRKRHRHEFGTFLHVLLCKQFLVLAICRGVGGLQLCFLLLIREATFVIWFYGILNS